MKIEARGSVLQQSDSVDDRTVIFVMINSGVKSDIIHHHTPYYLYFVLLSHGPRGITSVSVINLSAIANLHSGKMMEDDGPDWAAAKHTLLEGLHGCTTTAYRCISLHK